MSRFQARRRAASLCGRLGDDDGIDPRTYFDRRLRSKDERKARQLCKQVARTLDLVLSGELDDELLRDLIVADVSPAPNASRLLVQLTPAAADIPIDVPLALARLAHWQGRLRAEVARSIHRRKVPDLSFQIVLPTGESEVAR